MIAVALAALTLGFELNQQIVTIPAAGGDVHEVGLRGESPVWSPGGRRILFVLGTDVKIANADGTGIRRLAHTAGDFTVAGWSPDGKRVVYVDNFDILVRAAEGGPPRRLTHSQGFDYDPAWSPDGKLIAYAGEAHCSVRYVGQDCRPEIFVMLPDGSGKRRLTRNPANDLEPAWSPDGRRLAFVRCPREFDLPGEALPLDYACSLMVMRADGSGTRRLTPPGERVVQPAWSPDGRTIAFARLSRKEASWGIAVIPAAGGPERWVHRPRSHVDNDFHPSWLPG